MVCFYFPFFLIDGRGVFFSVSFRKSMKQHSDVSHDCGRQLPAAARQGHLSCPFCLYQTKNKNYMIDHIVLHRGRSAALTEFRSRRPARTASTVFFFAFSFQRSASSPLSRVARSCRATSRASSSAATSALSPAAARKACVCT